MVSCGFAKHNGNTTKVYCQNSFSQEHTKVAGDQKQRVRRDLAGSESLSTFLNCDFASTLRKNPCLNSVNIAADVPYIFELILLFGDVFL